MCVPVHLIADSVLYKPCRWCVQALQVVCVLVSYHEDSLYTCAVFSVHRYVQVLSESWLLCLAQYCQIMERLCVYFYISVCVFSFCHTSAVRF